MSQISPPIRIVLIAVIGLIASWMLFLRPKTEVTPAPAPAPATAPGVTGLSNAVDKAKAASATSDKANEKLQQATGEDPTATGAATKSGSTTAKGQAAKGAGAAKGLPAPVQKALDQNKILVLGFFNPKGADDRATRKALADVDRWRGEVVVRSADVKTVSRYGTIARGADVEQSPTIIVVDRNAKAETLVGYQDAVSVDQAVVDAMRASGGIFKDPYLRAVNDVCRSTGESVWTVPSPTSLGSDVKTAVTRYKAGSTRLLTRFKALPAPARWRAFKRAGVADLTQLDRITRTFAAKVGDGRSPAAIVTAAAAFAPQYDKAMKPWYARMDKRHVLGCGSNY